jgi:hypothetical protein
VPVLTLVLVDRHTRSNYSYERFATLEIIQTLGPPARLLAGRY